MNNHKHDQDRGTKKWTTMMLPEHKEQLKGMWKQKNCRSKPIFDEQQLESFHSTIMYAYTEKMIVRIFHCNQERYMVEDVREAKGIITEINTANRHIRIDDTWIQLEDILDIQLM